MAGDACGSNQRIALHQCFCHCRQNFVLRFFIGDLVSAFQLDADAEIVALVAPVKTGFSGVPRGLLKGYKLAQVAIAGD